MNCFQSSGKTTTSHFFLARHGKSLRRTGRNTWEEPPPSRSWTAGTCRRNRGGPRRSAARARFGTVSRGRGHLPQHYWRQCDFGPGGGDRGHRQQHARVLSLQRYALIEKNLKTMTSPEKRVRTRIEGWRRPNPSVVTRGVGGRLAVPFLGAVGPRVGQALPLHHAGGARLRAGAHGHAPLRSPSGVIDGLGRRNAR